MRFTRFRSQRNATGIFSKSEAALEQPRKVCAARLSRRKLTFPVEQPRESARGCEPSRTPSPRGCRGAERPTLRAVGNEIFVCIAAEAKAPMSATRRAPVLSGTKFSCKPPQKQKCRREKFAARLSRRKPKPPTEQPRESARGCEPSRIPSPRGCRGAEHPTLRIVGNQNLHQNTPGELERAAALSTSNRGRRPARRKGCLPKGQASRFATDQAKSKISVGRPGC